MIPLVGLLESFAIKLPFCGRFSQSHSSYVDEYKRVLVWHFVKNGCPEWGFGFREECEGTQWEGMMEYLNLC
jgi:hypothetical protein